MAEQHGKIAPDPKNAYLLQSNARALSTYIGLLALTKKIEKTPGVSQKNKEDVFKIIETFQFILFNESFITDAFDPIKKNTLFANETDRTNGVLRDHKGTSFHLNAYTSANQALKYLNDAMEAFLAAAQIAEQHQALHLLINECEYNQSVGCLEARMSKALLFAAQLQESQCVSLDNLFQTILSSCPHDDNFDAYLKTVKAACFKHLGETYTENGQLKKLDWQRIETYIKELFLLEENTDNWHTWKHSFSELQLYFDYLQLSQMEIIRGQQGMIQHRFSTQHEAEQFKQWLCALPSLAQETGLIKSSIRKEQHNQYVIRLSSAQIEAMMKNSHIPPNQQQHVRNWIQAPSKTSPSIHLTEGENRALEALNHPFYAKTITGFVNPNAWRAVAHAVTLTDKKDKAAFRDRTQRKLKPYLMDFRHSLKRINMRMS